MIRTQKTGATLTVKFPPRLMALIKQSPTGDMHFIATQAGGPFRPESFGTRYGNAAAT